MQYGVKGIPIEGLFLLDGLENFVGELLEEFKIISGAENDL